MMRLRGVGCDDCIPVRWRLVDARSAGEMASDLCQMRRDGVWSVPDAPMRCRGGLERLRIAGGLGKRSTMLPHVNGR